MGAKFYHGINAIVSTKEKLVAHRHDFENLDLADQVVVILNCVQYLKCNAIASVDLSKLGDSPNVGKTLLGNNISSVDFKIIHTSPCGLVVKERQV